MTALVHAIVTAGMLLVVPLGLRLLGEPLWLRRAWPFGASCGAVALWLPRGTLAVALAAGYAVLCVLLAARVPGRLRRDGLGARTVAACTALGTPTVAAVALLAERAGYPLFGFAPPILTLTVAHFHFAGFAAALVAGLVCRARPRSPLGRAAAYSVPAGTAIVLLGYFTGQYVELAGAVVLTAGMWLVGWLTWTELRPSTVDRLTRALLGVSAVILVVTMSLALWWALGEATGLAHPSLTWMAATHGVCNALGFALCGLAAWRRLQREASWAS